MGASVGTAATVGIVALGAVTGGIIGLVAGIFTYCSFACGFYTRTVTKPISSRSYWIK